ncbi:MAG: DUF2061 domain-containing protein [Sedimentisphaerales bacterium]|nr:DUF2061 domain-containing protein [Sedimentisphaerales bacterium]
MDKSLENTKETHLRSIIKGVVWRMLASLTTIILVYLFTRKLQLALELGGIEVIAKILLYYGHERIWNVISWGKTVKAVE